MKATRILRLVEEVLLGGLATLYSWDDIQRKEKEWKERRRLKPFPLHYSREPGKDEYGKDVTK